MTLLAEAFVMTGAAVLGDGALGDVLLIVEGMRY